jgi:hypothetical protein
VDWIARVSQLIKDTEPSLRILHTRAPIPALMPLTDIWEVHTDLWSAVARRPASLEAKATG